MNIRGISVTETIATLGVVGSLLFVGFELQQGNDLARLDAINAKTSRSIETLLPMATDERLAGLMAESLKFKDGRTMTADELSRVMMYLTFTRSWEGTYKIAQIGISDHAAPQYPSVDNGVWRSQFMRSIWPLLKPELDEGFTVFWEQRYGLLD